MCLSTFHIERPNHNHCAFYYSFKALFHQYECSIKKKETHHSRLLYDPMSIYILCLVQVNTGIYVLWNTTLNKAPNYTF